MKNEKCNEHCGEKHVKIKSTNFTRIVWFFMWLFFSCLILGIWLWLGNHPEILASFFAIH